MRCPSPSALLLACCVAGSTAACGPEKACGDQTEGSSAGDAPHIDDLRLAGQLEEDPWTMVLSLEFEDSDGNLGTGAATFYLNHSSQPSTRQEMRDAFRQNALPSDTRSGTLVMPLRFGDTIDDGAQVDLGVQLEDADRQRSNCYAVRLDFAVETTN
jgi:hypothetical protein